MRTIRLPLAVAVVLWGAGCVSNSPVIKHADLPPAAEVAIIPFRDCIVARQKECVGSGEIAGSIFTRVFSAGNKLRAVSLPRPVGPKETLSDQAAAAYAKSKGFPFVLNGEVEDYLHVESTKSRSDIASVSLRILRASDGFLVATFRQYQPATSSLSTPDELIENMARHVQDSLY